MEVDQYMQLRLTYLLNLMLILVCLISIQERELSSGDFVYKQQQQSKMKTKGTNKWKQQQNREQKTRTQNNYNFIVFEHLLSDLFKFYTRCDDEHCWTMQFETSLTTLSDFDIHWRSQLYGKAISSALKISKETESERERERYSISVQRDKWELQQRSGVCLKIHCNTKNAHWSHTRFCCVVATLKVKAENLYEKIELSDTDTTLKWHRH